MKTRKLSFLLTRCRHRKNYQRHKKIKVFEALKKAHWNIYFELGYPLGSSCILITMNTALVVSQFEVMQAYIMQKYEFLEKTIKINKITQLQRKKKKINEILYRHHGHIITDLMQSQMKKLIKLNCLIIVRLNAHTHRIADV